MNFILSIMLVVVLCEDGVLGNNARIIGGTKANDNYQFMVSLQVKASYGYNKEVAHNGWSHFCGGSILSPQHVITVAHCVYHVEVRIEDFSILAGTQKLNDNGIRYYIENVLVHPDFVGLKKSDLALLKLNETITFVPDKIGAITYSDEFIGGGISCIVIGWGYTNQNRSGASNDLLVVNAPTITNEKCREAGMLSVQKTEICTFSKDKEGFCGGDSGGPLLKGNLLVGIVSYNTVHCAMGVPDVYERVSYHYNWIKNNTST